MLILTSVFLTLFPRVRGMLISPEVRNAIHVGDRILEINGLPVGTMMEEEVGWSILCTHLIYRSYL